LLQLLLRQLRQPPQQQLQKFNGSSSSHISRGRRLGVCLLLQKQ
jgi:hypothetical protein